MATSCSRPQAGQGTVSSVSPTTNLRRQSTQRIQTRSTGSEEGALPPRSGNPNGFAGAEFGVPPGARTLFLVPHAGQENSPGPATSNSVLQPPQRTITPVSLSGPTVRILAGVDVAGVIVGDEVLSGHVRDANGPLLAEVMAEAGHRLRRISIVPDEVDAIGDEIKAAIAAGCDLIITSGGVGPTHDDMTLEGVAAGLDLPLAECVAMRERIDVWVERAARAGVTEEGLGAPWLRRMAMAPQGATLMDCSVPIPAFAISHGTAIVCVLPGPPAQFATAVRDAVLPIVADRTSEVHIEEVRHPLPESMLAQSMFELASKYPDVLVGSYPVDDGVLLRIKGSEDKASAVASALEDAIAAIRASEDGQAMLGVIEARRRSGN